MDKFDGGNQSFLLFKCRSGWVVRDGGAAKRQRLEGAGLGPDGDIGEETVARILAVISDPKKMLGPESVFPENAPRDEAAKQEERRGLISFHVIGNSLTQKVPTLSLQPS